MSTRAAPRWLHAATPYLLLLLGSAILCAPLLRYGAPNGHSIQYNLVWLTHFSTQLAQGDFYPRWLMGMNHGAGSPVFYFYAPLPFYILSLPIFLFDGARLVAQLGIGEWLLVGLSGMAFYRFARVRCAAVPAWIAALAYMLLPYHFEINLWWRQDIGELANYIWMPLLLLYTDRLLAGELAIAGLALVYGAMMLTHLPSALLFSIGLGFYVLVVAACQRCWQRLPFFAAAIGIGMALAAPYWIPALTIGHYVRAEQLWTPYFDFHHWFFPFGGPPEIVDKVFAQRLFAMIGLTAAIFTLAWLNAWRRRREVGRTALFADLALSGVALFLMSPWSVLVWEIMPVLWKVQFPWRIAMVLDLATAIALLYALQCAQRYRDCLSRLAVAGAAVLMLYSAVTADVLHKLDPFDNDWWVQGRDQAVRNGLDAPEYTTAWNPAVTADTSSGIAGMPPAAFEGGNGRVDVVHWLPRELELAVELQQPARLRIRQFYFPNWRATLEREGHQGVALALQPDDGTGLLTAELPEGRYTLHLRLAAMPQEIAGAAIGAAGLAAWAGCFWRQRSRRAAPLHTQ